MGTAWIAALAITVAVYLLIGCMFIVSARADRNAPRPHKRSDYEEAA